MEPRISVAITMLFFFATDLKSVEVEIFESEHKSVKISVAAISDELKTDNESTSLYLVKCKRKIAGVTLPNGSLAEIHQRAKKSDDGNNAFFGKGKKYIVRDSVNKQQYLVFVENSHKRFRMTPLVFVDGEWMVELEFGCQSENQDILKMFTDTSLK